MKTTDHTSAQSDEIKATNLAVLSEVDAPPLIVLHGSATYTFPVERDVTVGRGRDCDIYLHDGDPAVDGRVSRLHAILRFVHTTWMVVDKSQNGIFVNGARANTVTIRDRVTIALGSPHGPRLTFRVATSTTSSVPRNPPTWSAPHQACRSEPDFAQRLGDTMRMLRPPQPTWPTLGSTTIGRGKANDVVVNDALVSRVHAVLFSTPAGVEICDNDSSNGTFVNGAPVIRALLCEGDIVTVGNTDLVVSGNTVVPRATQAHTGGLNADALGLVIDGRSLLSDVSFTARPGTLTAVIGPSGAGKSTLVKLIGGMTPPSTGMVTFDGHDIHGEYASMRSRIGLVPQDDVVHRSLTVEQALNYAAELRLPPDTSAEDRRQVVKRVLEELDLTPHKKTRVDKLSGGQRKRASVALELLTGPSLLILDEPTSGLDPALDRQVMTMLRRLADAGRVVIVVTHSLANVDMCDQILLLAPGGKTAFADPPAQVRQAMGTTEWADIFARVSIHPDDVHQAFLARHPAPPPRQTPTAVAAPLGASPRISPWRQISTVARRQTRLLVADRGYFAFLAVLPFVLGVLLLTVPGHTGLGYADPRGSAPSEPSDILILLNIAAVFMGTASTIRDLVGERSIFQREQAVGLSASAYLAAKVLVYTVVALIQTGILTAIMVAGIGMPTHGAVLLGDGPLQGTAELCVTLAATAIVSAMVGLALSSLARSNEQVLPLMVVVIMVSMVLAGGLIPVTGRPGLAQVSWLLPARWGYAASASTVDLGAVAPLLPEDRLWSHSPHLWLLDMGMLVLLGAVATALVRFRLRLPVHTHHG